MIESINADNDYKNDNDDTMTMMMIVVVVVVMMMIGTLFTLVMLLAITHPNEPYMSIQKSEFGSFSPGLNFSKHNIANAM